MRLKSFIIPIAAVLIGATAFLSSCSCNKEEPEKDKPNDEIIEKEEIADLISSLVGDSFDADEKMEDYLAAIEANPDVDYVEANESGINVTYKMVLLNVSFMIMTRRLMMT